jgi:hypothetical protein
MALVQDKKTLHSISNNNNNTLQLVPIASSQTEQAPAAESKNTTHKAEQLFELVECQGWIRAGQVIIRASGMAL